jgi:DNA modification methylase/DNA-binding XRE family transcriptional regulator
MVQQGRAARGLSLSHLAQRLGFTKSYMSRLESGDRAPTAEHVRSIATLLDLPAELLALAAGRLPADVAEEVARHPAEITAAVRQRGEGPVVAFPESVSSLAASLVEESLRRPAPERGPFTGEVRAGKNTTSYRAHSYHTKVPPEAIATLIQHYTSPGALVLDPFCGSGMTGVAALQTGRHALLSDLSPAAVHIARNYTTACDPVALRAAIHRVAGVCEPTMRWLYGADSRTVEYTVWSDVFECPECGQELLYWSAARDEDTGAVQDEVVCDRCEGRFEKRQLTWRGERPVQTNTSLVAARGTREAHEPTPAELELIARASATPIPYWLPEVPFNKEREMWRAAHTAAGIASVQDFYTKRNLHALGCLRHHVLQEADERIRNALLFAFTAIANRASKRYQWNAKRPTNVMTGTLYISSLRYEWNVWSLFQRKSADVVRYYEQLRDPQSRCEAVKSSATNLAHIPDASIDYVFMDPPFGSNIFYADSSLLWDAWLGALTDESLELVVNKHRSTDAGGKSLARYGELMAEAFAEVRRVLKPGAYATLAFNNTDDRVWCALQDALKAASLEVAAASGLDKVHPSIKGVKGRQGREDIASIDALISLRAKSSMSQHSRPIRSQEVAGIAESYLRAIAPRGATSDEVYSKVIRTLLERHASIAGVTRQAVRECCSAFMGPDGSLRAPERPEERGFRPVTSPHGCVARDYLGDPQAVLQGRAIVAPKDVGPFDVASVQGSRNTDLYNAHSYHTKVPPEAIVPFIEHYTRPGDVVLDPFAGSGMTGVAAAQTGRRAILNDLAVVSAHLAFNHTRPCSSEALQQEFAALYARVRPAFAKMYRTERSPGDNGYVIYTLWSRDAVCPACSHEFSLWGIIDRATGRMGTRVSCPKCKTELSKHSLRYAGNKQVLVSFETSTGERVERPPSEWDLRHTASFRRDSIKHWYPDVPVDPDREMYLRSALHLQGIKSVADFYTPRNLAALALLWNEIQNVKDARVKHALEFAFTNTAWHGTRMRRFNARGGHRPLTGTLYIPQISSEANVLEVMRNKVKQLSKFYRSYRPLATELPCIQIGDAGDLHRIPDGSVDYVFTDPPFGSNIFYADCNLIWEAWLGGITHGDAEAVVNRSLGVDQGGKTVKDYERLMTSALREMHRVLKRSGWATLVFHNTDPAVWRALQTAADSAGFKVEKAASLDRKQQSHKGYKGRAGEEAVAHFDVILSMRKHEAAAKKRTTLDPKELERVVRQVRGSLPAEERVAQRVHSAVLRYLAVQGADLGSADFETVRRVCAAGSRPLRQSR